MSGLLLGKLVHYVGGPPHTKYSGRHLAALVAACGKGNLVDLQVFRPDGNGSFLVRDCPYSENKGYGTWHWPES